jgi:hypothetical protein
MDPERLTFIYGDDDLSDVDLTDLDARVGLLEGTFDAEISGVRAAVREIVANQILDDDPPEVWATVQRLLRAGLDRDAIFGELALAFSPLLQRAVETETPFDRAAYGRALDALPFPSADDIEQAIVDTVRHQPGIHPDDLHTEVLELLDRDLDDVTADDLVDRVLDELMLDPYGPITYVDGDLLVHIDSLTADVVLTHVLTDDEAALGILEPGFDLAAFQRRLLSLPDGALDHPPGTLLALRVDQTGQATVEALASAPPLDDVLVAHVRATYDRVVAEPWLPVDGEDLVVEMRFDDRTRFSTAQPPLTVLAEAAGLEVRGARAAHDDSVWHADHQARRWHRVMHRMGSDYERSRPVLRLLDLADVVGGLDPSWISNEAITTDEHSLRGALRTLRARNVLSIVADELFATDDDTARRADAFVDALERVAHTDADVATAALLSALRAEHDDDPIAAVHELERAHVADPDDPLVIDRLAWSAADRGDAAVAARLWRRLDDSDRNQDLREVTRFLDGPGAALRRNDPCWCGSGRKYKQCHLGVTSLPALPDRVGWLCRKAVAYLERAGYEADEQVFATAYARADGDDTNEALAHALGDPLVLDVVLTEGGWFERFLRARGALLPDDEALLAESWLLVDRTLYEVLSVQPGTGLAVRDLRTNDVVEIRERTFSRTVTVGAVFCGRAVPDGESHQLVGGLFDVAPGTEADLLDLLDERDPEQIVAWVAAGERPPQLVTREGEPLVLSDVSERVRPPDSPELANAMHEIRDRFERQWCDEEVPALGGVTPRQAAADPTRREALERLITSFERFDAPTDAITMRPQRLRELLGL